LIDFKNIVLITSVINTSKKPLSYTKTRSVYTKEERYQQTKKTIKSLDAIPDKFVILIEGSDLEMDKENYLKNNVDLYKNLFDDKKKYKNIKSKYKSLGEVTQTIEAVDFIKSLDLRFDNFIKITGRYELTKNFDYSNFENDKFVVKKINDDIKNVLTSLYKVPFQYIDDYYRFLIEAKKHKKYFSIGIEKALANFLLNNNYIDTIYLNHLGVYSLLSVSHDKYEV
jgi:hypothetical protein